MAPLITKTKRRTLTIILIPLSWPSSYTREPSLAFPDTSILASSTWVFTSLPPGATSCDVWELLLALGSRITSASVQGVICGARDWSRFFHVQGKYLNGCTIISLALKPTYSSLVLCVVFLAGCSFLSGVTWSLSGEEKLWEQGVLSCLS